MSHFLFRLPVRIYALAAIAVGMAAALTLFLLVRVDENAYAMRANELAQLTDAGHSILRDLEKQVQAGSLSPEEARAIGSERLTNLKFGSAGYFFGFDYDMNIQLHGSKAALVGTNQAGFKDVKGNKVYQQLTEIARTKGEGPLIYYFTRPNSDVVEAKMGYVKAFKPWGWVIGTGAYVADIEADISAMNRTAMIALGVVLVALVAIAAIITRSVTKPVAALEGRMRSLADGDTAADIPETSNRSEIGAMARTLDVFRQSLIRQKELEQEQRKRDQVQAQVVEKLSSSLSSLSHGDLTVKIGNDFPSDYAQLRNDFNQTVDTLSNTVAKVIEGADSIRNGAAEISQASDDLSNRTESQAATLEETAAALDELTASVKSAADGARSVEATMEEARREAENSGVVVASAVSAMTEIEQSSTHISQIISVIDDIAFQTNLLALNAGVEAARAGEAGRGFAVVASEVRALAQRSSDAAMEIKTLIGDSSKQVERGVDLVGKAGEALNNIVDRVSHISKLVSDIAVSAAEQSTGLNEINTGVTQLDQVTQQNAAMVEEATAAGHMLNTDAGKLAEMVGHFKVSGVSQGRSQPARAAAQAPAKPSAHGGDDWDALPAKEAPIAVAHTEGNAARDLWEEF